MNRKREARRMLEIFVVALVAVPVITMLDSVGGAISAVVMSSVAVAQYVRWTRGDV